MQHLIATLTTGTIPFAIVQKQDSEELLVLTGERSEYRKISDIPRFTGPTDGRQRYDTISVVPFCQIRERGYSVRDEGESILTLKVTGQCHLATEDFLRLLPAENIGLAEAVRYDSTEEEYAATIRAIVDTEIGNGEGANFVVPRTAFGRINDFSVAKALTIFRSLVENDYGTYWKFLFYDGERYFIGSTPERHLEVRGGRVRMNPISGTFRKDGAWKSRQAFKADLLNFLNDPKEINELFMVVDEELKMMARMCGKGGAIVGPLLKEMSRLIHSEYLLSGESDKDIFELFIDSMFAATVVGSPVENACNIIARYMPRSRRYYGSAMMLVGRDGDGNDILDSPITIRTAEIDRQGCFQVGVGATLVRDSQAGEEVAETRAKGAALLDAILAPGRREPVSRMLTPLYNDDEIAETLARRNQHLSTFWFFHQEHGSLVQGDGERPRITIIHNEDDFVYMLSHMLSCMGLATRVVRIHEYTWEDEEGEIVLLGPGPGNPNDDGNPKIAKNMQLARVFLKAQKPLLAICLGHQILCRALGFAVHRKPQPLQGVQCEVNLFGRTELVGFYNTFAPVAGAKRDDIEQALLPGGNDLIGVRGKGFIGYQFHPESLLTKNGFSLLFDSVKMLLDSR